MFASHTHRRTVICAIVCALLASALTSVAPAGANEQTRAALAQERYYSSYGEPGTSDAATSAAEAQERYYSSYGEPEPLTVAQAPEPSDDSQWLPIVNKGELAVVYCFLFLFIAARGPGLLALDARRAAPGRRQRAPPRPRGTGDGAP